MEARVGIEPAYAELQRHITDMNYSRQFNSLQLYPAIPHRSQAHIQPLKYQ